MMTFHHGSLPGRMPNRKKSIRPPENVSPIDVPVMNMIMNDRPANTAWIPNSHGAMNRKVNSIGSVMPVRNDVRPAESRIPAAILAWLDFAWRYIA